MTAKKKILIVDDDAAINEALQFILEDAGYEVITALNSNKVTTMMKQQPDLVLLDIWMPGKDGREVCKDLKSDITTKDIPVVMISATPEIQAISKESGANDYIIKPFEMKKLLAKVEKFI